MNNNTYYAMQIKQLIKMPDILSKYGFRLNRQNRIPCPFHHGHDANMGIKEDYYHCFVCGAKGDIINFVQNFFGISFVAALSKINTDFELGLPIGKTISRIENMNVNKKLYEIRKARQEKTQEYEQLMAKYWSIYDEWVRLDQNRIAFDAKTEQDYDNPNPLYVEAIQKLSYQEYLLDCIQNEVWHYGNGEQQHIN